MVGGCLFVWKVKQEIMTPKKEEELTHAPQVPCTELAPTGSSIFSLSRTNIDNIARPPPRAPITMASHGRTTAQPPVPQEKKPIKHKIGKYSYKEHPLIKYTMI